MRSWGIIVALVGVLSTMGVAMAREGGEGPGGGGMPSAVRAIRDTYHAKKEQLRNECQQKMQALAQEERTQLQAAMKIEHDKRMQQMEERYQERVKNMNQRMDEHRQERPNAGGASSQRANP